MRWVQDKNLAGICVDSVDKDDSTGKCLKQKWPYLTTVSNQLKSKSKSADRSGSKKDECNFTGKMADDKDCYIYYECKSGTKMKEKCKHGSVFNSKTNRCDWNLSLLKCKQTKALVGETKPKVTTARTITQKTTTSRTTTRAPLKATRTTLKRKTWTTLKPTPMTTRITHKITAKTTKATPKTSVTQKNDPKEVFGNSKNSYKLLCYITNWSFNRKVKKFAPEDLDQDLCTHNVYAYAYLDPKKLTIKESNSNIDLKLGKFSKNFEQMHDTSIDS